MHHRILLAALVVTAAATSAGASQPVAMNLVCEGQVADDAGNLKPFMTQISVDLKSKHWCDQGVGCPYSFPILAQHGDDLQLLAVKTPFNEAAFDLNLKTGAFARVTRIPDRPNSLASAKGVCKPTSAPLK